MKAQRRTRCNRCNQPIEAGQEIEQLRGREWAHKECDPNDSQDMDAWADTAALMGMDY